MICNYDIDYISEQMSERYEMKLRSIEIAKICGVSRGTVDRALNDRPGINQGTRAKIIKVAEELGYRPNFLAQSLVKGMTLSIGVILFDINNRILAQVVNAIEQRAREQGYFVYLTLSNKDAELEKEYLLNLVDRKVDGIALLSVNKGPEFEVFLRNLKTPIVTFGNKVSDEFPFVWINDYQAIQDAVIHIISKGYTEIIYVSPPLTNIGHTNLYGPEKRYMALIETCRNYEFITCTVINHKNYLYELDLLLRNNSKKTAILCSSDVYAINILNHLNGQGIRVPKDIGLMGFDNIDILKFITPGMTTVDYHVDQIGYSVIDQLLEKMKNNEVDTFTCLEHAIIERDTL